ncbi:MAG: hypothetical protein ACPG4A_09920, partial [Pseudomonadales bacterium]
MRRASVLFWLLLGLSLRSGLALAAETSLDIFALKNAVSAARIEQDVTRLTGFGTRHTLSDTRSESRGIGAARRWIASEFEAISATCGGCLEVKVSGAVIANE